MECLMGGPRQYKCYHKCGQCGNLPATQFHQPCQPKCKSKCASCFPHPTAPPTSQPCEPATCFFIQSNTATPSTRAIPTTCAIPTNCFFTPRYKHILTQMVRGYNWCHFDLSIVIYLRVKCDGADMSIMLQIRTLC